MGAAKKRRLSVFLKTLKTRLTQKSASTQRRSVLPPVLYMEKYIPGMQRDEEQGKIYHVEHLSFREGAEEAAIARPMAGRPGQNPVAAAVDDAWLLNSRIAGTPPNAMTWDEVANRIVRQHESAQPTLEAERAAREIVDMERADCESRWRELADAEAEIRKLRYEIGCLVAGVMVLFAVSVDLLLLAWRHAHGEADAC